MSTATTYSSGNAFEKRLGYHRAVRKGPFIFVSGTTTAMPDGKTEFPGDGYRQAMKIFEIGLTAITALGGSRSDVCRVRVFIGPHEVGKMVERAFSETFGTGALEMWKADPQGQAPPAVTMTMLSVGKDGFMDPEMLLEIELDAVVG